MGTVKQVRVPKYDIDAIVNQPTKGQATAELEKQIRGLQYTLSDKVRKAIIDQEIRVTDFSMKIGLSYAGLSQVLRHAFNIAIDTMETFMEKLFPGVSIDEVCFGVSRPTRIPIIANLFMNLYEDLSSIDKQATLQKLTPFSNRTNIDREERVKEIYESNGNNRCYDETFAKLTSVKTNASSSLFWRATNEDLISFRTRSYMRFAVLSNYAMDYFASVDYTKCNLTKLTPKLNRVTIPEPSKEILKSFNKASKEERMDLVADMLATVAMYPANQKGKEL